MRYSHLCSALLLPGFDLYCNFTGFDVAGSAFEPDHLDSVATIDLSNNKFVGECPQVNSNHVNDGFTLYLPWSLSLISPVVYRQILLQLFADLPVLSSFDIGINQMSGDISGLKFKSNTINLVRLYTWRQIC